MRAACLCISLMFLVSCAGRSSPKTDEMPRRPVRIPRSLVFEKEISGRILGFELNHPSGVAVDARGNIYFTDTGNHRLIKVDPKLTPQLSHGGYGAGVGKFLNPEDIIIDRGLNVYVLDTGNRRVVQLDVNLNYVTEIIPEDDPDEIISNVGKLSGLQISPLGELTVADYDNSRLIRMDSFNRFSRYIGDFGYGRGALLNPLGLAADDRGRLYVADGGNGRIAVYDDYGNFLHDIGRDTLSRPSAVAVSPFGLVWAADQDRQAIVAFSADGAILLRRGDAGKGEFGFAGVEALAVSRDGRLYLADAGNNRILIYRVVYEDNQ